MPESVDHPWPPSLAPWNRREWCRVLHLAALPPIEGFAEQKTQELTELTSKSCDFTEEIRLPHHQKLCLPGGYLGYNLNIGSRKIGSHWVPWLRAIRSSLVFKKCSCFHCWHHHHLYTSVSFAELTLWRSPGRSPKTVDWDASLGTYPLCWRWIGNGPQKTTLHKWL